MSVFGYETELLFISTIGRYNFLAKLLGLIIVTADISLLFSKPLLLQFGDVRVEADSHIFSSSEARVTANANPSYARFTHLVQYCGIAINSIQLVLLDAIPGCMLHMSGDELLVETFRSREGLVLFVL